MDLLRQVLIRLPLQRIIELSQGTAFFDKKFCLERAKSVNRLSERLVVEYWNHPTILDDFSRYMIFSMFQGELTKFSHLFIKTDLLVARAASLGDVESYSFYLDMTDRSEIDVEKSLQTGIPQIMARALARKKSLGLIDPETISWTPGLRRYVSTYLTKEKWIDIGSYPLIGFLQPTEVPKYVLDSPIFVLSGCVDAERSREMNPFERNEAIERLMEFYRRVIPMNIDEIQSMLPELGYYFDQRGIAMDPWKTSLTCVRTLRPRDLEHFLEMRPDIVILARKLDVLSNFMIPVTKTLIRGAGEMLTLAKRQPRLTLATHYRAAL